MEYLFSPKKEGESDTRSSMEEPWGHYSNWNKPVTETQTLYTPLIEVLGVAKFAETENRLAGAGGAGEGSRVLLLSGSRAKEMEAWAVPGMVEVAAAQHSECV